MKCPICNVEGEIIVDEYEDASYYKCNNCLLKLDDYEKIVFKVVGGHFNRVIENVYADLKVQKSVEDVFCYIALHHYNFTNERLTAVFSNSIRSNIRNFISNALEKLEDKESICVSAFLKCCVNSNDDYERFALLAFTNKRIICYTDSDIISFDYLKSKFKVCGDNNNCYFQFDNYIFKSSLSTNLSINTNKKAKKVIFGNYNFDKTIRYIIDGKRRTRRAEKIVEERKQKLIIKQALNKNISDDIKAYLKKIILSDYELTNEKIIFDKLKENFDISYKDFEENTVEEHFTNYIIELLEELKPVKTTIKDKTLELIKKGNDESTISKILIEEYNITEEATIFYINKAKNVIKNENDKKESDNKKLFVKNVLTENHYDVDKTIKIVQEKYQMSENGIKKIIDKIQKNTIENIDDICEKVLIDNEGNIFKSIKVLMNEYNISQETAKRHLIEINNEINGVSSNKDKTSNESYINNTSLDNKEHKKTFAELLAEPYNGPKCPNCGSGDIGKIGTVKRIASVELFGIASSTIGKTMECHKCGYKW